MLLREIKVNTKQERTYQITTIHEESEVYDIACDRIQRGECGVVFVNTVKRCLEVYETLKKRLGKKNVHLAHSRFTVLDRNRIEKNALFLFGKNSTNKERAGQIMICTQVFQESINLDFDFGILDLAYIDSLFQRMGRVWRYKRNGRGEVDDLLKIDTRGAKIPIYVFGPVPVKDPGDNWYSSVMGTAKFIYPDTQKTWDTMNVLKRQTDWKFPQDARELLESVFRDHKISWKSLEESDIKMLGAKLADRGIAKRNALTFDTTYMSSGTLWDTDETAVTRLGYPTTTIRLALFENNEIVSFENRAKPPEFNEISYSLRDACGEFLLSSAIEKTFQNAIENKKCNFVRDFNWLTYLILKEIRTGIWQGYTKNQVKDSNYTRFYYTREYGLLKEKTVNDLNLDL